MTEPLTADLEADEPIFQERLIGLLERVLQSDFVQTDQSRDDLEILIGMLREAMRR